MATNGAGWLKIYLLVVTINLHALSYSRLILWTLQGSFWHVQRRLDPLPLLQITSKVARSMHGLEFFEV